MRFYFRAFGCVMVLFVVASIWASHSLLRAATASAVETTTPRRTSKFDDFEFFDFERNSKCPITDQTFLKSIVPLKSEYCDDFSNLKKKIKSKSPISVAILGGSNTQGIGVSNSTSGRRLRYKDSYPMLLEDWLRRRVNPLSEVHNFGRGAVGSCYWVPLLHIVLSKAYVGETDLLVVETRTNDLSEWSCFEALIVQARRMRLPVVAIEMNKAGANSDACFWRRRNFSKFLEKFVEADDCDKRNYSFLSLQESREETLRTNCFRNRMLDFQKALRINVHAFTSSREYCFGKFPFEFDRLKTNLHLSQLRLSWDKGYETILNKTLMQISSTVDLKHREYVLSPDQAEWTTYTAWDGGNHLGLQGHRMVALQLAVALDALPAISHAAKCPSAQLHPNPSKLRPAEWMLETHYAFDKAFWVDRSRNESTNKHKPLKNGKLAIQVLSGKCRGFKLYADVHEKPGWIAIDDPDAACEFDLPPHSGKANVHIGFLVSYHRAGKFNVTLIDPQDVEIAHKTLDALVSTNGKVSILEQAFVGAYDGRPNHRLRVRAMSTPDRVKAKIKILQVFAAS